MQLNHAQHRALIGLLEALVDQDRARVIVPASRAGEGHWFGGGNLVADGDVVWLCGRYRDHGDSRTGLAAGVRGWSCALFRSDDGGDSFERVQSWSKAELSRGPEVLSIEGTALHRRGDGRWELFVSTEQARPYPQRYRDYQKPGTGVWSIDCMTGPSPDALAAATLAPVLATDDPAYLHVKDPVAVANADGGTSLLFCSHPVSWASSNTGLAVRPPGRAGFTVTSWQVVPRGNVWDVAVTRVTDLLSVPRLGRFAGLPPLVVLAYDGAESMRRLEENPRSLSRPRGYSCEELGGALWAPADDLSAAQRLSATTPLFVSPHGSGSSRYLSTAVTDEGIVAVWQQAQPDGSQPLVAHALGRDQVERILSR